MKYGLDTLATRMALRMESGSFVDAVERKATPPMQRFRDWIGEGDGATCRRPTKQEIFMLTVPVLLLPIISLGCSFAVLYAPHFEDKSMRWRVLMFPVALVLMPFAAIYVLCTNFAIPMFRRIAFGPPKERRCDFVLKAFPGDMVDDWNNNGSCFSPDGWSR